MRYPELVRCTGPPTSTRRDVYDVVVWLWPIEPIVLAEESVFLKVGVGGDAKRIRMLGEEGENLLPFDHLVQGDVHHQHYQAVSVDVREVAPEPLELGGADRCLVAFVRGHPPDIVEDDEVNFTVIKRVVARTVELLERFVGEFVGLSVVVDVVIAQHIVPGKADEGDGFVVLLEYAQVVEENIA